MKSLIVTLLISTALLTNGNPKKFDLQFSNCAASNIVFDPCQDLTICSNSSCQESVLLSATASSLCPNSNLISYSWSIDLNNDGMQDILSQLGNSSNEFSGIVPFGRHRITFTATDQCGSIASCSYQFLVKDCEKPIPVCINGLSAPNMPVQKLVTIWASDWISSASSDNCCATADLVLRVEKLKTSNGVDVPTTSLVNFNCTELGSQPVRVWAGDCGFDENGNGSIEDSERNWDFSDTYIFLSDDDGVCTVQPFSVYNISAINEYSSPIVIDTIMVSELGGPLKFITTNSQITFVGPQAIQVTVSNSCPPMEECNQLNGINILDVLYITNHILGKQALTTPYRKIAADVNRDKKITAIDIFKIRQWLLHNTNSLPYSDLWRFIDKNYQFTSTNEQAEAFPEFVVIDSLSTSPNIIFIGVKNGQVIGSSANNAQSVTNEVRSSEVFSIHTSEEELMAGQEYRIDFKSKDMTNILAYQMTLGFDTKALDFLHLEGLSSDDNQNNFGLSHLEEGLIPIIWTVNDQLAVSEDGKLFSCRFKAKQSGKLSDFINMESQLTPPIGFNKAEEVMNLEFDVIKSNGFTNQAFALNQNTPNPFKGLTSISFNLPEASRASLSFYDVTGKLLKLIEGDFPEGQSTVEMNEKELNTTGVVYYKLETEFNVAVKKMLLIN